MLIAERLPLSYAQQRLWFLDRFGEASAEYNMPSGLRLLGDLDVEALHRAINTIVERHESLRTHFGEVDGEPLQVIEAELHVDVPFEDLSGLEAEEREAHVRTALREEGQTPFDLSRGPLLRVRLLRLGEREHVLLRTMHHIVSDGWSEGIFNRELSVLYEAYRQGKENPLSPLAVQYADFTLWQREWLESGAMAEGLAYWKNQLDGIPERLELPTDRPRPAAQSFAAETCEMELGRELADALRKLSRDNQATLYMTLLAAFAVLLSRYSGQQDIVIGSPIANRQEAQLEEMIGFFVNTLVMRVRLNPKASFRELLADVRNLTLDAYQHQDVPFERLVEELAPERTLNSTPFFQVSFALQNAPAETARLGDLDARTVLGKDDCLRFALEVDVRENISAGTIRILWLYQPDTSDRWRIEQRSEHYLRILQAVVDETKEPLSRIAVLNPKDRQQLLGTLEGSPTVRPEMLLQLLFEEQVRRTPEAVALVSGDYTLSYAELTERANRLAHALSARGAGVR